MSLVETTVLTPSLFTEPALEPPCPVLMAASAHGAQLNVQKPFNGNLDSPSTIVGNALKSHIEAIDLNECEAGAEDAFFVADLGAVYRQHLRWKQFLPRVDPFYAVKCNPDNEVVKLLASLGTGFDCASKTEISQILSLGVSPSRIIYAHPCKTASYVRYAAQVDVRNMTFDNSEELFKCKRFFPQANLILRISTDDSKSLCRLSQKYGADFEDAEELLNLAKNLELNVVGVSFHVGSGSWDPAAFVPAVKNSRAAFDIGCSLGFNMNLLDVGGGFGDDNFEEVTAVLRDAIDEYFPQQSVKIIAEPGRFYVSSAFTIAANVIARRAVKDDAGSGDTAYMLYLNDGVYGNFSGILFDHQQPIPRVLKSRGEYFYAHEWSSSARMVKYSLWGPTCDGLDCITKTSQLPATLEVGDWLYFSDMGAYNNCSATKFNGFSHDINVVYVNSEAGTRNVWESGIHKY